MSFEDIDGLPSSPALDASGHTSDHGKIHRGVKALKDALLTFSVVDILDSTAFGRSILQAADAASVRQLIDAPTTGDLVHSHTWDSITSKPIVLASTDSVQKTYSTASPTDTGATITLTSPGTSARWIALGYADTIHFGGTGKVFDLALVVGGSTVRHAYLECAVQVRSMVHLPAYEISGLAAGDHVVKLTGAQVVNQGATIQTESSYLRILRIN